MMGRQEYIHIEQNKPRSVILYFHQSKKDGVIVNWGDGSESQTVSSSGTNYISHTFKDSGDYCVTFEVMDGCSFSLKNSFNSSIIGSTHQENGYYLRSYIRGIEFGHGVTSIANYSFNENDSIAKIVIPKGVTSIGNNAFYGCNISSLVIPQGVKSISENSLPRVENISFPKSLETIGGNALQNSFKLHAVIIPPNVTNIPESCCSRCFDASPIIVPKGVSDFGTSAFSYCQTIQSFVIPQGVRLTSIIIPSSVTQIGEYTFYNSSGLKLIDFTSHSSIPTLKNYNAFSGIASACKIVVPDELYDSWISATNWSNSNVASKIVKASEFNG